MTSSMIRDEKTFSLFLTITILLSCKVLHAQTVSVGGMVGNPLGLTMRWPVKQGRALDAGFGPDYFGSPRLQLDYVYEFRVFNSTSFDEYAGPGLAIAFAKGMNAFYTREFHRESFASEEDNGFGIGARAIFGMDFRPAGSPLDLFLETGPMFPASRNFDIDIDAALGFRYKL